MNAIVSKLQTAVRHHQAGELAEAERLYRGILRVDPRHSDALHLLGVVAHQQSRDQEAVELIGKAIEVHDGSALYHCNLGASYRALGRYADAEKCFRSALGIDPEFAGAHLNLGMTLEDLGRPDDAVDSYRRAIERDPSFADAHNNLGRWHAARGEYAEAKESYLLAIRARPNFAQALYNLGNTLTQLGEFDSAISSYQAALKLAPHVAEISNNLGVVYKESDRYEEAADCFRQAVRSRDHYAEAHNNLGSALQFLGDIDGAEQEFSRALAIDPDFAGALTNLGNVENERGSLARALECYEQALAVDPDSAEAHFNRALAWLRHGCFAEGWPEYEWRFSRKVQPRSFAQPRWSGESLATASVLLYGEQGVGDEIQFASCVPEMIKRSSHVVLECDPRLRDLFARSFPGVQVVARPIPLNTETSGVIPAVNFQIALGSLPRYLRHSLEAFPNQTSYLVPDQNRVDAWKQRLGQLGAGLKIGITWRGGKERDVQQRRSTSLSQWLPIFRLQGVHFISLQYGDHAAEMNNLQQSEGITMHDWSDADRWNNLDDLAAEITALDLVISVDNSTAHLGGALGASVWTLLPFVSDWRWMMDRDSSPWYPTMRLFRQPSAGDWDSVFDQVAFELQRRHCDRIGE